MQIDTHNRKYDINDPVGYKPSFLPQTDANGSVTQLNSGLSPLIECPCTDRIDKEEVKINEISQDKPCQAPITTLQACVQAIKDTGAFVGSSKTVSDPKSPHGCSMVPTTLLGAATTAYTAVLNTFETSTTPCGTGAAGATLAGSASLGGLVNMSVSHDGQTAQITLSGPANVWFGVGFGASRMADMPYTIIVDGTGKVTERKLASHAPGTLLSASVKIVSSKTQGGTRTVVLSRPVKTADYALPALAGDLPVITAVGSGPALAYHAQRTGATLTLLVTNKASCVCTPTEQVYFNYMNGTSRNLFHMDCGSQPRSDMAEHGDGTGRNVPNQACTGKSYHGGLQCCKHTFFLTDLKDDHNVS
jgi:hypothetical protein